MRVPRLAALYLALAAPSWVTAQVSVTGADTLVVVADPGDALGAARSLQAAFERARERHLPRTLGSHGGPCDEVVGRLCSWYGEGEWYPTPEPEGLRELRRELVAGLDSLQGLIPADSWVLGQRVWYRGEGGDWSGALVAARGCGPVPPWWCAALEGLALHGLHRYLEAEGAFGRALGGMDPELALEWRVPDRTVDPDGRGILDAAVTAGDETLKVVLERLWWLSDPLYLVEGNDRMTAHYARWTVATLKDGARNPYRLSWARDLEELTVRHGWEIGWERSWASTPGAREGITGHKDPEGRDYLPSGRVLADPTAATSSDLGADRRRPRSLYAPPYAPVLLPMDGQLALFPRGDRIAVVATHFLPTDTTYHVGHDHPRPWMETADQAGISDRIGLFAVPVDGGARVADHRLGSSEGALMIEVPAGAWVVSAESWSPERRRAGRSRIGFERAPVPSDVATLSDLLLISPTEVPPTSLQGAVPYALRAPEIDEGQGLAVAWEVAGLGLRAETLRFEVGVERTDRGLFRRIGEAFRLAARPVSVALSWEEPGPDRPTHHFRSLDLGLPPLEPGDYVVTLTLRTAGRDDVASRRTFRVVE
jgi:hypothetical protein